MLGSRKSGHILLPRQVLFQDLRNYTIVNLWLHVYTHIYITDAVKIVNEDYTVLTPKQLGEASLLLHAGWMMCAINLHWHCNTCKIQSN